MAVVEREPGTSAPPWTAVLHDWVTTVDHKKIGILYVLMAIVFLVIGGVEALLMRWQLWVPRSSYPGPDNTFLDAETFNQLFTMHGTTMVFFVGMPILIGVGNYAVPLQIGARDMAFPRLNSLGGKDPVGVQMVAWYWHFVDVVWIVVFTIVYVVGRWY